MDVEPEVKKDRNRATPGQGGWKRLHSAESGLDKTRMGPDPKLGPRGGTKLRPSSPTPVPCMVLDNAITR